MLEGFSYKAPTILHNIDKAKYLPLIVFLFCFFQMIIFTLLIDWAITGFVIVFRKYE